MSEEEQIKVINHELMHIPITFGGGFKHHNIVTERNVNLMYKTYIAKKEAKKKNASWFQTNVEDKLIKDFNS